MLRTTLALALAASLAFPTQALAATPEAVPAPPAPIVLCAADLPTSLAAAAAEVNEDEAEEGPDLSNLAWRHGHLQLHQAFGLATLASIAATGAFGYWLSDLSGNSGVFDGHLMLAGLTTGLYLTTGTLALTAPAPALAREEGPWDTTRLHRNLAWLHAAGMVGTVGLGFLTAFQALGWSQYHGWAAYSTIGLMTLSAGVIVFGQ